MLIFGVLGHPVSHSLSPAMHTAAFAALGLDALYTSFDVPPHSLRVILRGLLACGIDGLSVTIPHKETIIPLLDRCDDEAHAIGAVNTVVVRQGRAIGYNTDVAGLQRALTELGWRPGPCQAVILGAGGAARAAAWVLSRSAGTRLTIANRHVARAQRLAQWLRRHRPRVQVRAQALSAVSVASTDVLINATPIGIRAGDPAPVNLAGCSKRLVVYDLVYNRATALVRQAKRVGGVADGGLGMLVYQGAEAFRLWTGRRAPIDVMRHALNTVHSPQSIDHS